jgi:glycosyltransferase involved in cell wall biosynthesis
MKIVYIATFPPRKCGIATFTDNLIRSMADNLQKQDDCGAVVAVSDEPGKYAYSDIVGFEIERDCREDYIRAADYINSSGASVCVLQHEYGIFGGHSGVYILSLLHRLEIPFLVTFHTVLKKPDFLQKTILREIARRAAGVVVMSHKAVYFLDSIYEIPSEKIHFIPHGVPEFSEVENPEIAELLTSYAGRPILFTFGLLNRNKGIETVIRALPQITSVHPEVVYLVLGNTHPGVLRASGEEYRRFLWDWVVALGMEDHVRLIDGFVTEAQLASYLRGIDIYITPYLNEAQITSGTLSYALGAGACVLSTPYWHAQELLAEGRGLLFPFRDSGQLARQVIGLLDQPEKIALMQKNAWEYARQMSWPKVGRQYVELARTVQPAAPRPKNAKVRSPLHLQALPSFDLSHVSRLTDTTGILQHAKYGIPNLKEGYCIDDNSRALILTTLAYQRFNKPEMLRLLSVYFSFVHYMQREDGQFRNFLTFRRDFTEEVGSEDAFGRSIWALGFLIRFAPNSAYREAALEIFYLAVPHFDKLVHLRGIANTVIGICHYLSFYPTDEALLKLLYDLSGKLEASFARHATTTWRWFEEEMTYDNPILPLAMLHAYRIRGDAASGKIAMQSLDFLEKVSFHKDWYTPIGNQGWFGRQSVNQPLFDQQALETMAMVLLYQQAYEVTGQQEWIDKMARCHAWFLGANELHIPLYDDQTCGCCDGLQPEGLNRNQGAESTLAYWIAHLAVRQAMEQRTDLLKKPFFFRKETVL